MAGDIQMDYDQNKSDIENAEALIYKVFSQLKQQGLSDEEIANHTRSINAQNGFQAVVDWYKERLALELTLELNANRRRLF